MAYAKGSIYWIGSKQPIILEDFEKNAQAEDALWRLSQSGGALLYGPPGTGKTTLLAEFARPYLNKPTPTISKLTKATWLDKVALWATVQEYVDDVQAEFKLEKQFDDWGDHASASGIARSTTMLFLDDLGAERETDYTVGVIADLVARRHNERSEKQTYFTTNLDLASIGKRYGQRTLSRLCEMCCLIEYGGEDRRIAKAMRGLS